MINYIIGALIIGMMLFALSKIIKKAKEGTGICGCSCSSCSSNCSQKPETQPDR